MALADFFAKLAEGGLSVGLPRIERTARGYPSRARLALTRPDLLEKDPILRIQ
jgi:hypothetical protein